MNHFYRFVLLAGLFALISAVSAREMLDSKGKDFWIAFPKNYQGASVVSLFISSETATSGTISIPGMNYTSNFTTTPGTITIDTLNKLCELVGADSTENKGIHIVAQDEVTVYALSRRSATTDAYLCLPTDILGNSYIVPSYIGLNGTDGASQLVVVGTQNSTSVTITPTVTAQSRGAFVPFTITLNQGQAYQLKATDRGDLTGSIVTSSAPVAVFGSVQCVNVPVGCSACDFIAEEIPPVTTWGKNFISAPLAGRNGDTYRFLASEDNTTITVNDTVVAILDKGEFFEGLYYTGLHITSDKAILVIQYSRGQSCAGAPGDPFMMLIPPYEQFLGNYTISTSDNGFSSNYINLVVPTRAIGDVKVDGVIVSSNRFTAIGSSGFYYAAISVTIGTHTINSNYPVGVHVYGFGSYDSYGYPGGQSFSEIAYIDSIILAPATSGGMTGVSSCVQATVFDNNNEEFQGARVDFYARGANTASGFAFTDSNGVAEYCYVGLTAGTDTIYAVTGSLTSNTVYKTWSQSATKPFADAGPDQSLYGGVPCNAIVTLDGSGSVANGGTLSYRWEAPIAGFPLTGVSNNVTIPVGIHEVFLIVTNSYNYSDTDTVKVTVVDNIPPAIPVLQTIKTECSVTVPIPVATDNCTGLINGTTVDPLTYTAQGTYTVHWTYTDASGNAATQEQTVVIDDTTAPVISVNPDINRTISALADSVAIAVESATATDNCTTVSISASRSDGRALNAFYHTGSTTISWIGCDGNGNCDTAFQIVNVIKNRIPVLIVPADTAMLEKDLLNLVSSASDSDGTVPVISLVNALPFITVTNNAGTASVAVVPGCSDHGTYMVTLQASDGIDSVRDSFQIRVDDVNFAPVIAEIAEQKTIEQQPYTLNVNVNDCDGTIPVIKIVNSIPGALFTDNRNSTGTFQWTPAGDANGYYVLIFEATDGVSVVRDTVLLEVVDANCFPPVLNVSNTSVNASKNLPVTILVSATDGDGVLPVLGATDLPAGSVFTIDDVAGTGVFNWTPSDTGTYSFTIKATDAAEQSMVISSNVVIYVNGNNVTGPVFVNRNDTIIDQNREMVFRFEAHDPDGTVPQLYLISGPAGVKVVDNKNGTGSFVWTAPCDVSGSIALAVGATDQILSDTLIVNVNVRDVNCTPVINKIPDIVAGVGELVKFTVSSYDPDNDGSVPILSSASNIPDATFTTRENGTAEFKCVSPSVPGTYPIAFYATDGNNIDSMVVLLSVAKFGQIRIIAAQKGAKIYSMPSGSYYGSLLGTDSAICTVPQGTSWFEVQADGYQAQRIPCTVAADSVIVQNVNLKPSIPLMVSMPDTLTIASAETYFIAGSMSFADLDRDRIVDMFIASDKKCSFFGGVDSVAGLSYKYMSTVFNDQTIEYDVVHQVITDWDNNGIYDCILSERSGNIISVSQKGIKDTLIAGTGLNYPVVFDADRDGKKDLIVHKEGVGIFMYPNIGTDNAPVIGSAVECRYAPGNLPVNNGKGAPVFADIDNDNMEEMILLVDKVLKVYDIDNTFTALTYKEDLNCAGERIRADSLCMALMCSPRGMTKLVIKTGDKILVYRFSLLGDVNNDAVVNIQDISKISKQLEMKSTDPGYERINNLKLSDGSEEVIDIKDISKASKCWELKE